MIDSAEFEYGTWESDAVERLRERALDRDKDKISAAVIEKLLQNLSQNKSPSIINAIAVLIKDVEVSNKDHFAKTLTDLENEIEEYFANAFRKYLEQKATLSSDVGLRPISFVQLQDYGGLDSYLKKHGKDPLRYPIDIVRGRKQDTMVHTAVRIRDWKALKIILKYKCCDILKRKCTDEGFNPLALFVLKYDERDREIFKVMLNSGFDLLQCVESGRNSALGIIIRLSKQHLKYNSLLDEAIRFLKSQGIHEKAIFEKLEPDAEEQGHLGSAHSRVSMMDVNADFEGLLPVEEGSEREHSEMESGEHVESELDDHSVDPEEEYAISNHSNDIVHEDGIEEDDPGLSTLLDRLNFRGGGHARQYVPYLVSGMTRSNPPMFKEALHMWNADAVVTILSHVNMSESAKKEAIHWLLHESEPYLSEDILMMLMSALIKHGADINGRSRDGITPLMNAVLKEDPCLVKIILEHGADTQLIDNDGNSAMTLAQDNGSTEIIRLLQSRRMFARLESSRSTHRSPTALQDGTSAPICVICMDRPAQVILAPCGHRVLCKRDCKRLFEQPEERRKCPMDHEKIESFIVNVYDA